LDTLSELYQYVLLSLLLLLLFVTLCKLMSFAFFPHL
jgi:hypothetical protein